MFPLTRYWYSGGFRFYYAYGNTPPQDFLQNCFGKDKPSILVLGCGDIRSCFYSLWKHLDVNCPLNGHVKFVLNDVSAAVIARNILFLYFCLQMPKGEEGIKKWLSGVWAIWYCHELYPEHKKLLHNSLRVLCKHSASWCSKENPLYPIVKFCSSTTLDEVCKVWKMWLEYDITIAQMQLSRQTEYGLHGNIYHSDDSVSEYVDASVDIPYHDSASNDCQAQKSEVHSYVATGNAYAETVLDVDMPADGCDISVNVTLYERPDGRYSLHYGSIPYSCYFQAVKFTAESLLALNPSSKTKFLVGDRKFESLPFLSNSIQQFSLWLQASHRVLQRNRKAVSFEFDCSDGLSFCLNFERKYSFDVIYTSNLIDHMCPPNLILSVLPLMKEDGIAVTATLMKNVFSTFEEYLVSSFGFGCKLFPVILGIRCINYEGGEYSSPVTIRSQPLNLQKGYFNPNEKLVVWEKVGSGAIPLVFPSGSELLPVICDALANCIRVCAYPLLVDTKMPLMLNSLCVETAAKVLQVFVSNTCGEYAPSFWKPLSAKLCTTVKPYLHSVQTQLLLHGIHMHLTVTEESCPCCLRVPLSSGIGLFHARIFLLADFQTPNFLALVHKSDCDSVKYLHGEALKGNDVHVFDCVAPSTHRNCLDLYFYAPLHLSQNDYKVTLVISRVGRSENTLAGMSQAPTAPLRTWEVPYSSFIFFQAFPRSKTFVLSKFGVISSHTSDGDKSEIVVDLLDRVVEASSVAKLQTEKVSSNELNLSCGKVSCCIEFLYPFDYNNVHIKLVRKEKKLFLVCPRTHQQFHEEKPVFVLSPEKELSLFPNIYSNQYIVSLSGQQYTKEERSLIEFCGKDCSERSTLVKVKECLVCFFLHPEQDFFNLLVPTTGLHILVLINSRFFDYENRTPVLDISFCFLEESFMRIVLEAWTYISPSDMLDMCNIKVDDDEYGYLKQVFNYFACRTRGNCGSTTNPSSNVNLLIEGQINRYFTRAVISLLLCDPEHYFTQVVQPGLSEQLDVESNEECGACGSSAKATKFCSKCKSVKYCSKECQRAHWKVHKKVCKEIAGAQSQVKKELLQPLKGISPSEPDIDMPVEMLPPKRRQEVEPPFQPFKEVPKAPLPFQLAKKEIPVTEHEDSFRPFPLTRYCYGENSLPYYAYGNTPPEDYLQNSIEMKKPLVLLLGCKDICSCFYTLWKNFDSSISTKRFSGVNFVVNNGSSAALARNILLLYLVIHLPKRQQERKAWLCAMWAIWYCHELYPQHQQVLDKCLTALVKHSGSLRDWESPENPLRLLINFSSPFTLSKISEVWTAWSERRVTVSVEQMHFSRCEKLKETGQLDNAEYLGQLLCRVWSICVCDGASLDEIALKIGSRPDEVVAYIRTGNCFAESTLNIGFVGSTTVNPTLYERQDGVYSLDSELLPFGCYHHTVEFSPSKLASSGVDKSLCETLMVQNAAFAKCPLLANCVQQFSLWAQTASRVLCEGGHEVHFTYDNRHPLSFCQQLQHRVGSRKQLFDLIYTSTLIDDVGLPGVIMSGMPLVSPCGLLFTKTLCYKKFSNTLDEILGQCFGFDCKLVPVILGIRCVNNEGAGCSSPVMVQPLPAPALSFETTQRCSRVLIWKKVLAHPLIIDHLPDIKSGNITEALLDSITKSAFSLLNRNCSYVRNHLSNNGIEMAITLLQSLTVSVESPLDSYKFWEPLSTALRGRICPFLSCFQTQLLLHSFHMHLTVTEDDCPLCLQTPVLRFVGLFRAEVALPLVGAEGVEPMFMAMVHRRKSCDPQDLCSEARFGNDVHIFDCIIGTVHDCVLKLEFFAPKKFVEANYRVTILCQNENIVTTAVPATSLKDLQIEFFGRCDFAHSRPSFLHSSLEISSFGKLTSHVCDGNEVQSEITLSTSTLQALSTCRRKLQVTKIAPNQLKFSCLPHQFVLKLMYPISDKFHYELFQRQKIVIKSCRESHLFCDEDPIFVTNPDHRLCLPTQNLSNVMVLYHCTMQYTPEDVRVREECVNDPTLMPHLLNFKDAWLGFFRDRHGIYFLLQSLDFKPLGLALIDRCVFDCEHKVPALDMAFCFFDDCDRKSVCLALDAMTCGDSMNTVNFDPEGYKILKDLVKYLSKRTNGDCKSAGCGSRYNILCQHGVDIYFSRVVAYALYSDPDLGGLLAVTNHLDASDDCSEARDLSNFPVQTERCHFCGEYSAKAIKCSCKKVQYCSTLCQSKHWPQHCGSCDQAVAAPGTMSGVVKCCYCGNTSDRLRKCTGCLQAQYCGRGCQGKHWAAHKLVCKKMPSKARSCAPKVESTTAKVESTSAKVESTSAKLESTSAKVQSTSAKVDSTSAKLESTSTSAKVQSTSAKVDSTSAKLEPTSAKVQSTSAKLESTSANFCKLGKEEQHSAARNFPSDSMGKDQSHLAGKKTSSAATRKKGSRSSKKAKKGSSVRKSSRSAAAAKGQTRSSVKESAMKEESARMVKESAMKEESAQMAKESAMEVESARMAKESAMEVESARMVKESAKKVESAAKEKFAAASSEFGLKLVDFAWLNRDGCGCCGKCTVDLVRCSSCGLAQYCSEECRKNHWKSHKNMCLAFGTGLH